MRGILFFILLFFFVTVSFSQSIFANDINSTSPNSLNPYTIGQIVHPDISVSGISRGSGITGINANNRYDAVSWNTVSTDPTAYFEFTISPNAGKKINFIGFVYAGQASQYGPTQFAFRSSNDNFVSDIGLVSANGTTVSLSNYSFQNITSSITFRIYGWGATDANGSFSINDFIFNGLVDCVIPDAPILPAISFSCSSTSVVVNWLVPLNAVGFKLDVAIDSNFNNFVSDYNNKDLGNVATATVTGLISGSTYYIRLHATNNCGNSVNSNIVMVSPPITTYSGALWSNGDPDETKNVSFLDNYTITAGLSACSCRINSGVAINVNGGAILKLENALEVLGTATLTFENNSSLVQVNDAAANTGSITYKRITTPMKNFDFTYWSSPVSGQSLYALSPNTFYDKYWSFSANNWFSENSANIMSPPGKGYAIRTPKAGVWGNGENVAFPYSQAVAFIGIPNNGVINLPIEAVGSYNLIGNPYASALNANAFLTENSVNNTRLGGTIYLWTHNTVITNNSYGGSADYAIYNLSGGTAATSGGSAPLGNIAAGQSFFIISTGNGPAVFNNSMRVGAVNSNGQFYKSTKLKTAEGEKHRVWLDMTNADGLFKQILVGYIEGATNGMDVGYDGESLNSNKYIDFYSIIKDNTLAIQGRALPLDKTDQVSLGYKTTIEGTFEIKIAQVDGILVDHAVFLEDHATGIIHNLKNGSYSFTTQKGTFNDRFVLVYVDKTAVVIPTVITPVVVLNPTLETPSLTTNSKSVIVSAKNNQIKVNSFDETIDTIMVYDLRGRKLYENLNVNRNEYQISTLVQNKQLLIVVIELKNGLKQSKEIIY